MLEYRDFYKIATYGNENWKGCFSAEDVAYNAYDYTCDYEYSRKERKLSGSVKTLLELLKEDIKLNNDSDLIYWIEELEKI